MKRYILCLILVGTMMTLNAASISRDEALTLAASFLKQSSATEVPTAFNHLFVFNGENGFVILSDDDRVQPVLGYSFENQFDTDMAESTMEWLGNYDAAIEEAVASNLEATDEIRMAWTMLREDGRLPVCNRSVVKPLVVTVWKQQGPYNMYCPQDCLTGCVATALGQLMKYWEYPRVGSGQHSYTHSVYGQQSANFGATSYDWDNMPDHVTEDSPDVLKRAVATLCYHCGVAVEMNYGPDFSGAFTSDIIDAMTAYFKYPASMSLEGKQYYSDAQWKAMLKTELDASRPMYYDGSHGSSGHAFICDGYDASDYFHINWGWGGSNNGYYAMGALNPTSSTSYNEYNYVIIGIQPSSFAVASPTGLGAVVHDKQVQLSWSPSAGANYYKVYRDGMLIAPVVSQTHYEDTPDLGVHSYYVKAINASGERSARSNTVEVEMVFSVPAPIDIQGEVEGDELSLAWSMPFGEEETLVYGAGNWVNNMGYNGSCATYWGQRYPKSHLMDLAGMTVTTVSTYLRTPGTYTLYVGKGTFYSFSDVLFQKSFTVSTTGWCDITLDTPMRIDYTSDLWVAFSAPSSINYPAVYCSYDGPGLEEASYISTGLGEITAHSYSSRQISWMIKVILSDDAYTYSVSRDGSLLASGLSERAYTDSEVTTGPHVYHVWAALDGVDSEQVADYETELAYLEVVSTDLNAGDVEGGGLAEIGSYVTVTAYPHPGHVFMHWRENGTVVSTEQEYTFRVADDRQLEAVFSGWGVDEDELQATVRQVEVFTVNGVLLETITGDLKAEIPQLKGYAKGMYLLRLTTDKGVMMSKMILGE